MSVTRETPVSKKSLPGVLAGLLPSLAQAAIASTPFDAISSGYCCDVAPMTPSFTFWTPGQAAIDRDDQHVVLAAERLQRLIGPGSGRFIDGVDDIDHRIFCQQALHRLAATFLVALGDVVADDPRVRFISPFVRVTEIDAEAFQESLIAQHTDGRLADSKVEHGDLGILGLVAHCGRGPFSDQFSCKEIVRCKGCRLPR